MECISNLHSLFWLFLRALRDLRGASGFPSDLRIVDGTTTKSTKSGVRKACPVRIPLSIRDSSHSRCPASFAVLVFFKDGKISWTARSSCVSMQPNRRDLRRLSLRELRVLRGRRSHSSTFDASDRENMKIHEPRRTRSARRKPVILETDSDRSCGTSWFDRFLPLVQPTLPLLIFSADPQPGEAA